MEWILASASPRRKELLAELIPNFSILPAKGEENAPEYLVGVVYNEGKAKYICYAFATDNPETPPEEIAAVCTFVPTTPYDKTKGFFIIFQSASTGECIQPSRV